MKVVVNIPDESIKNTYRGNIDVVISFLDGLVNDVYCDESVEHFDYKVIPDNTTNTLIEDAISREEALRINELHHGEMPNHINYQIWQELKDLPSSQQIVIPDNATLDEVKNAVEIVEQIKDKLKELKAYDSFEYFVSELLKAKENTDEIDC